MDKVRSSTSVLGRVEQTLRTTGLLQPPHGVLVVAVSGGPDSLTLLGVLHTLAQRYPFCLYGAHLNHGLRGVESDEDASHVEETFRRLELPYIIGQADVAGLRTRSRLSWEAAAREARYDFLGRVMSTVGASAVALGHTADDQAETILLHLLRGTGIRGLRGMLPWSRWRSRYSVRDVVLVRPLLQVTRQETEAYCATQGLLPRYDSSNLQERFTRNRIRRNLMPRLRAYNPRVREAITRLARTVAQDVAYIDQRVQEAWPSVVTREPWGLRLSRGAFGRLEQALKAHLLQRAYADLVGEVSQLNLAQVEGMLHIAAQGAGHSLSLGHHLKLFTSYQELIMTREAPGPRWPSLEEQLLPLSGEVCTDGWQIRLRRIRVTDRPSHYDHNDPFCAYLSRTVIGRQLWVRTRRAGDRFEPLGMDTGKKLKEFMIDAHIPRAWRDGVPLVVSKKGIAWVVGSRIAQWARVSPETREVVEITFARQAERCTKSSSSSFTA